MSDLSCLETISAVMKAVDKTVKSLAGLVLTEVPAVVKTSSINESVFGLREGMLISIMQFFRHVDGKKEEGLGIITIPQKYCEVLFKSMGIMWNSPKEELKDMTGEYCNMFMGCFKMDLSKSMEIEITLPKTYIGNISDMFKVPDNHVKFSFIFKHNNKEIIMCDLLLFNWEV